MGSAYEGMSITENEADHIFAGTAGENGHVQAQNASTVVYLNFEIPDTVAAGKYNLTFNGDVIALTLDSKDDSDSVNVTEVPGYILVLDDGITVETVEYQYNVIGKSKFYFAHDNRAFDMNDLLSMGTLRRREKYSEAVEGSVYSDWTIANEFEGVTFKIADDSMTTPMAVYEKEVKPSVTGEETKHAFFRNTLQFAIEDEASGVAVRFVKVTGQDADGNDIVEDAEAVTGTVYIGVKGDASLNGITDAVDASRVLIYAADDGVGLDPSICPLNATELEDLGITGLAVEEMEDFVYFLSDVTSESEDRGKTDSYGTASSESSLGARLDAFDAAKILMYSADSGIGTEDWYKILNPRPKYTEAIGPTNPATVVE